ncbi:MAG: GMP/IMP nucleotidase [Gammaproteobacteria bacterium]
MHPSDISWQHIETVFLDMDGTLLDLHFDNHFWQEHLPRRYAEKHGLSLEQARARLAPRFRATEGTMDWYCLDYWSRTLDLDIVRLKEEVAHLIAVHPHVPQFLHALRRSGRRTVLVTNAHHKSLALKMKHTRLGEHLDAVVCAHDLGLPKEEPKFWRRLQRIEPFMPATTLLIDDNLAVLRSARDFGFRFLLALQAPDSRQPPRSAEEFPAIRSFRLNPPLPPFGKGGSANAS